MIHIHRKQLISMITISLLLLLITPIPAKEPTYFAIHVIDEQTGRGIPLVELKTVNGICYYTDSNGCAAIHEPGLMNQDVFFFVGSHGYSYPADGFGMEGVRLHTKPGTTTTIQMTRINIAERLYRITGQGIYRDSVLLDKQVPLKEPVLNGQVVGQDSALAVPYQGKLYWFWGDTLDDCQGFIRHGTNDRSLFAPKKPRRNDRSWTGSL